MERVVIDEFRGLGKDEALLARVLREAHSAIEGELATARRDRDNLRKELTRHHKELQQLVASGKATNDVSGRIAELHGHLSVADKRLPELDTRIKALEG